MASSNVQFYENQKKLQDVITKCEEKRMNLDQQLKKVFQSDQTTVKLKAARLHSYWKKICEDERRAKQRNEMILIEFERIDTHMSELNARTQRLALMKKQYEDVILRKYPSWSDLMNGSSQSMQLNEGGDFVEVSSKQQHQNSEVILQIAENNCWIFLKSSIEHIRNSSIKVHKPSMPSYVSQAVANDSGSNKLENMRNVNVYEDSKKISEQTKWHLEEQVQADQKEKQKQSNHVDHQSIFESKNVHRNIEDKSSSIYANIPYSHHDPTHAKDQIKISQHEETQSEVSSIVDISSKITQKISDQLEEDVMDFMSGSDLPMAHSFENTQISAHVSSKAVVSNSNISSLKPELTVHGLIYLLKFIESDMVDAFEHQGYYRSSWPDTYVKNDIIRKGNANEELSRIDANLVSMVILEQITLIIRNLSEKCLLPKKLLEGEISGFTSQTVRKYLSSEAESVWNALFAHFTHLVKMEALEPNELSAIFIPSLVSDGSLQEKGHQFLCQLLGDVKNNANQNVTDPHFNASLSPMPTLEGSNSFMEDGRVPPLKFGSLLDKPFSDDESSYSHLLQDNIPLNETEAYKSMISTDSVKQARRQSSTQEDTTDDDVEKQLASAIKQPLSKPLTQPKLSENDDATESTSHATSHLFSPRAVTPRQAKPMYGSIPGKFGTGITISSDLDTDCSEVDAVIFGSSKQAADDFDFYD